MVYQFDDIALPETMRGQVTRQCHIGLQLKLYPVLRLSGICVTNVVTPEKYSVIQNGANGTLQAIGANESAADLVILPKHSGLQLYRIYWHNLCVQIVQQ